MWNLSLKSKCYTTKQNETINTIWYFLRWTRVTTSGVNDSPPCSTGSDIASTSDMAGQDTSSGLEQASASLPVTAAASNFGRDLMPIH